MGIVINKVDCTPREWLINLYCLKEGDLIKTNNSDYSVIKSVKCSGLHIDNNYLPIPYEHITSVIIPSNRYNEFKNKVNKLKSISV